MPYRRLPKSRYILAIIQRGLNGVLSIQEDVVLDKDLRAITRIDIGASESRTLSK